MATLSEITSFLNQTLATEPCSDPSVDGLQVDAGKSEIKKIGYAVDSGLSIIESAVKKNLDLLLVHHGLFWRGTTEPLIGPFGQKIRLLIEGKCSLYASHLPLDGHPVLGNGAQLAKRLHMTNVMPYLKHSGVHVGVRGTFASPRALSSISETLSTLPGAVTPLVLPFGKKEVQSCAIVTGAGGFALEECVQDGIDLLISGEPKQSVYHRAKEANISAIFAGHYATETVGVAAVAALLKEKFNVDVAFIDEPTGI